MAHPSNRIVVAGFALVLALALSGCISLQMTSQGCYATQCEADFLVSDAAYVQHVAVITDAGGCADFIGCDGISHHLCNLAPDAPVGIDFLCGDPLLAEWPADWNIIGAVWTTPGDLYGNPPASGSVLIEPAASYPALDGEPVVTDAGMAAHVLQFDRMLASGAQAHVVITFSNLSVPNACAKAIDVAVVTVGGTSKFITPIADPDLDFTRIRRPGPETWCFGPDTATAVPRVSWGSLKLRYR